MMSGPIKTEYRGYTITYSENGDEWTCMDLSRKGSAPTLSKMKANIDDFLRSIRKEASVACLELSVIDLRVEVTDATITEYLGPRIDGSAWSNTKRHVSGHGVAISAQRRGNEKISRQERDLTVCVPLTPEADAAIAEAKRLAAVAKKARDAFEAAVKAIPRVSLSEIEALVKVSGIDPTGGLKSEGDGK